MKTNCLIGDSGGTSTNWCWIDELGNRNYFENESYHPVNFSEIFFERMKSFWQQKDLGGASLYFYGAGCGAEANKQIIKSHFVELGFKPMEITSDVLGATQAFFGNKKGRLVILGTGSVLVEYNGEQISRQIGGLGHLLGDEGSAYYFGKLLLQAWLKNELSSALTIQLESQIAPRSEILALVYGEESKKWISDLALKTAHLIDYKEIENLHKFNLNEFAKIHLGQLSDKDQKIVIIGSYGEAKKELLNQLFSREGFSEPIIVKNPLENMVNRVSKNT